MGIRGRGGDEMGCCTGCCGFMSNVTKQELPGARTEWGVYREGARTRICHGRPGFQGILSVLYFVVVGDFILN